MMVFDDGFTCFRIKVARPFHQPKLQVGVE